VDTPATAELLSDLGLASDASLLGSNYFVRTLFNKGDAQIKGVELSYRQSLTFLPAWARGFQIFGNATRMWVHGSNTADLAGFTPSNYSAGINFIRPRYFIKLNWKYQGDTRRAAQSPNATTPPDTYTYLGARTRWGLNAQYSVSKRVALFLSADDVGGGVFKNSLRYAPNTPEYAKPGRIYETGWSTTVGVRGKF
jgi:outer membrane receptor for ferrienterochelin and colicin